MRVAHKWGVWILTAAVSVWMVSTWHRERGGAPAAAEPAAPATAAEPIDVPQLAVAEERGLLLYGYVRAHSVDPRHWRVRATPLSYGASSEVKEGEVNSRGQFELGGLGDMDYRVQLVSREEPTQVLASVDYVRPGGDELVLELDWMVQRRGLDSASLAKE